MIRVNKYLIKYGIPNQLQGSTYTFISLEVKEESTPKSVLLTVMESIKEEIYNNYQIKIEYSDIDIQLFSLVDSYDTGRNYYANSQLGLMGKKQSNAKKKG